MSQQPEATKAQEPKPCKMGCGFFVSLATRFDLRTIGVWEWVVVDVGIDVQLLRGGCVSVY